jgi:hypothetical protein
MWRKADFSHKFLGAISTKGSVALPLYEQWFRNHFRGCESRVHGCGCILEYGLPFSTETTKMLGARLRNLISVHPDLSGVRPLESCDTTSHCGFTRPGWPDKSKSLASRDLE